MSSVRSVFGWPATCVTSVMSTVPRTPATAFGVFTSIRSPGFIFSLATASAIRPEVMSMVEVPPLSVIVSEECSRTVTTAAPPSRMRASD